MKQLYKVLPNVEIPVYYRVSSETGELHSRKRTLPACVMMHWPDGRPCVYADMYLAWRAGRLTVRPDDGGSLKELASGLTHLVRYCAEEDKEFGALVHDDIVALRTRLLNTGRANNTTINRTIHRAIDFLRWFQDNIAIKGTLVGVPSAHIQPRIRLIKIRFKTSYGRYGEVEVFDSPLPSATPDPDGPISVEQIAKLWDAAEKMYSEGGLSKRYAKAFTKSQRQAHLKYLKARRELMLEIMEALGCRPGELVFLRLAHLRMLSEGRLVISTLKRGRGAEDPSRQVPVSMSVRIKLELFEKHRKALIERLRRHGTGIKKTDAVFLEANDGKPMSRDALRKEFRRLRVLAGVKEKLCLRMFRHRFITNMVKLHLIEYVTKTEHVTYATLLAKDIRTILTRVMRFTGHKKPESLLAYVNLALDELGVFRDVDNEINRLEIIRAAVREIHDVVSGLREKAVTLSKKKIVEMVTGHLEEMSAKLQAGLVT